MRVDVLDSPSQNIRKHFDSVIEFIGRLSFRRSLSPANLILDNALCAKGNVLVHCSAGISRSPTLVLAYMMKKNHWMLDEAFDKMRQLRRIVDPNVSFIVQLKEWEKSVLPSSIAESNDEHSGTNNTNRTAPAIYCGTTSKSKADNKPHTDAVITVK